MYQVFRVERLKNLSQLRHTLSWKFLQALGIDSDTLVSWSRMGNKITRSVSRMTQTLKPLNPKFKMFRDFES